jgi:HK97 family phage major capsid protein
MKDGKFVDITAEQKGALSVEELAVYTTDKQKDSLDKLKAEMVEAQKDYIKDLLSSDEFAEKMTTIHNSLKEVTNPVNNEETQKLAQTIQDLTESVKTIGGEVKALKENGIVNEDLSINKGVLRTIVETHLKEAGLIGDEVEEKGVKVRPLTLKNNQVIGQAGVSQRIDLRKLSRSHAEKAGENMFINTGGATQTVFNQAINRSPIGEISDPLTANEHALDIFNTTNISGSLMTLMIYENLEANGELVAEGVAPTVDSRIELNSKDFKVFDFAATATVSKDQLRDSMEVVDELVRQLQSNLKTVLDNVLFVATGDNSASPWGIFNTTNSCELFNPLLFTGTSPQANIISVIGKAKLQARLNDWMTDSSILNPKQWDQIEDLKDLDENSVRDNRLAVNALGETIAVKGLRKYQTTKMPENTLLVYNAFLQTIGLRQDIETQFGHNADDFKKRKVSFVMDMRASYGQKAIKSSIYVDNISDAIAILSESAAASLTRVQGYASGSDATALTIATLINTGVNNVIDANLEAYKTAIAAEVAIADLAALQVVVDAVNAA